MSNPTTTPAPESQASDIDDVDIEATRPTPRQPGVRTLATVLLPIIVLAAIAFVVASEGDRILNGFGHNPPPADELLVERVEFHEPRRVEIDVINPQADPITPAMLMVDAAIVNDFEITGGTKQIDARERRTIEFTYDWIEDDPYLITLLSSSGVPTDVEVPAAVPAQTATGTTLAWGAIVGLLVGFVPVALGLVWLPALRQLSKAALAGFLAFTAGLLAFLAVDATAEAFDSQALLIPALGGAGVVLMGIAVSMVALALTSHALRRGAHAAAERTGRSTVLNGGALALLVAVGIGLHNFGEGLAIGSSFATGEASLAIALVIGFMIHNLTEGIGIAAPIARAGSRLTVTRGIGLAIIAGTPAVLGIWAGRHLASPLFTTLCFAIAAGAALQVIVEIVRSLRAGGTSLGSAHIQGGFAAGLLVMWATGILAG